MIQPNEQNNDLRPPVGNDVIRYEAESDSDRNQERRAQPRRKIQTAFGSEILFKRVESIIGCELPKYMKKPLAWAVFQRLFTRFDTDRLTGLRDPYPMIDRLQAIIDFRADLRKQAIKDPDKFFPPIVLTDPDLRGLKINAPKRDLTFEPCTITFCDINKFKHINDTLNEENTDKLIRAIANILKQNKTKGIDMLVRYNAKRGDEFAFLMEGIDRKTSMDRMKKILGKFDDIIFHFPASSGLPPDKRYVKVQIAHGVYELDDNVQYENNDPKKPMYDTPLMAIGKAIDEMQANKKDMGKKEKISHILSDAEVAEEIAKAAKDEPERHVQIVEIDMKEIEPKTWVGETLRRTWEKREEAEYTLAL